MKVFKRIVSLLLVLLMLTSVTGCEPKDPIDDAAVQNMVAKFPVPSIEFSLMIEHELIDKAVVDDFLARMLIAYNSMDAEAFCEYAFGKCEEFSTMTESVIEALLEASEEAMQEANEKEEVDYTAAVMYGISAMLTEKKSDMEYWMQVYSNHVENPILSGLPGDLKVRMGDLINDYTGYLYDTQYKLG